MADQPNQVVQDVSEFYDDIGDLVEIVGGNLHVGYWTDDNDDTPFLAAMQRVTGMIEDRLELRAGQTVLDVGCGVGEPAVWLAQRHDVVISGVTVSRWQVAEAGRRVVAGGVRGRVTVDWADASELPFPDAGPTQGFDAALAFDSVPNADHKARWLTEIWRVLRPGGRFVFTEYPRTAELTDPEQEILRNGAIIDPPASAAQVIGLAETAGFEVLDTLDCGDQVRRTYDEFFRKLTGQRAELADQYGADRIDRLEQGMRMVFGVCREKIGYLMLTCRKPA